MPSESVASKIPPQLFPLLAFAADSPNQALQLAETHEGVIDLLLTDVIMSDMSGRDLWEQLGALRPDLKCLLKYYYGMRDLAVAQSLNPALQTFAQWLTQNKGPHSA